MSPHESALRELAAVQTNHELIGLTKRDPIGVIDAARWAVAEIDRLNGAVTEARRTAQGAIDERDRSYRNAGNLQGYELHEMDGAAQLAQSILQDLPEQASTS